MKYAIIRSDDYLIHHGVKGQKWGVRRFQNDDGSLTEEGHERYSQQGWESRQMYKRGTISKDEYKQAKKAGNLIGKLDNISNLGLGRRIREFQDRHKKGMFAANVALNVAGAAAVTALTGGAGAVAAGQAALGGILGSALRLKVTNPLMLKYGYNSKITGEGFKSTRPDYGNKKND